MLDRLGRFCDARFPASKNAVEVTLINNATRLNGMVDVAPSTLGKLSEGYTKCISCEQSTPADSGQQPVQHFAQMKNLTQYGIDHGTGTFPDSPLPMRDQIIAWKVPLKIGTLSAMSPRLSLRVLLLGCRTWQHGTCCSRPCHEFVLVYLCPTASTTTSC